MGRFDLIIVCISLGDNIYLLTAGGDGSGLSVIRLLRILRVVRLFKRLKSLQKILVCIMSAIQNVLHAFLLFGIILSIYAVIAVSLFYDKNDAEPLVEFSSFSSAFFTLLAITTGGINWSAQYVMRLDAASGLVIVDPVRGFYFVLFDLSVIVTTFNIMLAVLLEGFVSSMDHVDASARMEEEALQHHKAAFVLDPLLHTLSSFTSPMHLKGQLAQLFAKFDVDGSKVGAERGGTKESEGAGERQGDGARERGSGGVPAQACLLLVMFSAGHAHTRQIRCHYARRPAHRRSTSMRWRAV